MYKISLKKLVSSEVFVFLFMFLQFMPQIINYDSRLKLFDILLGILQVVIYGVVFLTVIAVRTDKNKNENKKILTYINLFLGSLVISSIINSESVLNTIVSILKLSIFCIFVSKALEYNYKVFLKNSFNLLFILMTINLISIFAFPNGLYRTSYYYNAIYFMGAKNKFFSCIMPLVILSMISYNCKLIGRNKFIFANIVAFFTMVYSNSSTGLLCYAVFMIINFLNLFNKKLFLRGFKLLLIICIIISILITVFRIHEYFSDFIYKLFKKDITLSGRVYIWDCAIEMIKEKPIIGHGLNLLNGVIKIGSTYYYSHNLILEILLAGGIVSGILFILILSTVAKGAKNATVNDKNEYCLLVSIFVYMIMGIAEVPITANALYMFIIMAIFFAQKNKELKECDNKNEKDFIN